LLPTEIGSEVNDLVNGRLRFAVCIFTMPEMVIILCGWMLAFLGELHEEKLLDAIARYD
jgi:hypothetical protein